MHIANENLNLGKLNQIHLKDAFWGKYTKLVTEEVLPYQWRVLNDLEPDGVKSHCIENFRIAAGEKQGEFCGEVFQDTDVAKWIESAAYSLSYEKNPALEKLVDDTIDLIGRAQQEDGYLDTYFILKAPESKFRNLQQGHELYTAGHMMEAAAAYYEVTGKDTFLNIMCKNADLICQIFGQEEYVDAVPGHEEVELGLIRLYEATGKRNYLDMAKAFVDRRGETAYFAEERKHPDWIEIYREMTPEDTAYAQCHEPVRRQSQAVGHAVRAVYLYCAMTDLAREYEDEALFAACERLYENMVKKRMYLTGGIGSSGYLERFTADYDLPNDSAYAESCASIGLALFCRRMAQMTGDGKYIDTMETALMNTVLAGIAMDGKSFFYVNPLEVWPENCLPHTSMAHVRPVRQKWFACACCPPNIARTLASLGAYVYFTKQDSLWLNLYVSAEIEEKLAGVPVKVTLASDMPFYGTVQVTVATAEAVEGEIAFRCPSYAKAPKLSVNGRQMDLKPVLGYWRVRKEWKEDIIEISFDMPSHFVYANPNVRADSGKAAVRKGPLVYCLEEIDNGGHLCDIFVDTGGGLREEYREDLLGGTMVIHAKGRKIDIEGCGQEELYTETAPCMKEKELMLVPYCYWDNRTPGEMQVWMKYEIKSE